jgi:hypothetical protein
MKRTPFIAICVLAFIASCAPATMPTLQRTLTVKDLQQLYNKDATVANTNSVLYRGSDNLSHHFLSQTIDKWLFVAVAKTELSIAEEKPYKVDSVTKLGYYYVDPNNHFAKIRDFN